MVSKGDAHVSWAVSAAEDRLWENNGSLMATMATMGECRCEKIKWSHSSSFSPPAPSLTHLTATSHPTSHQNVEWKYLTCWLTLFQMRYPPVPHPTSYIEPIVQPNPILSSTISPVIAPAPSLSVDDWLLPPRHLEAVIVSKHITVATYISLFDSHSLHSPYKYLPFLLLCLHPPPSSPFVTTFKFSAKSFHPAGSFVRCSKSFRDDVRSRKYWMEIYLVTLGCSLHTRDLRQFFQIHSSLHTQIKMATKALIHKTTEIKMCSKVRMPNCRSREWKENPN